MAVIDSDPVSVPPKQQSRQRHRRPFSRARAPIDAGLRSIGEMRMNADAGLEAVRRDVLFATFRCLVVACTILLPVALSRDLNTSAWLIVPHFTIYAVLLTAYVRRNRLPSSAVAALMLLALYLLGTIGLLSFGILGLSFLAYALIVIATPMAFGLRIGTVAALVCGATYAAIAMLVSSGIVTFDARASDYLVSRVNWVHTGIIFAGFAAVAVAISGSMYGKIRDLVRSEVARSQMLKSANEQLADANERLQDMNARLESRIAERTRRLEEANRELGSFSYTVSHDLRSPLQVIEGFSSLALQESCTQLTGKAREYMQRIQTGARRMHEMIDHLLQFSQVAGAQTRLQSTNLSEIAESIAIDLRVTDSARHVLIDIQPEMTAMVDPGLIRNVLHNLLANAWKFTAKSSCAHIEFALRNDNGETVYFVRDNGVGFSANHAQRLFEPFVRLHDKRDFAGHGVGLATTRRIVERHGGRIWAESQPGQGAVFCFTLKG